VTERDGQRNDRNGTALAVVAAVALVALLLVGLVVLGFLRSQSEASEAMVEICDRIEVGAAAESLDAIVDDEPNVQTADLGGGSIQVERLDGQFLCICTVEVADGVITSVGSAFCVD